ncbi:hypothetical protein KBI52_03865 [Microvirga sp. HBU67558]|uniref:hypothetical protein n=1 Tax=Microvirga TaxID=186650 RepID=UPI001B36739C|nr:MULTISPECIES: hypothetical protein [unclassified Microvirga]MBQ0819367.1 hypothetical protein [Microvirga sp. HBU67558]
MKPLGIAKPSIRTEVLGEVTPGDPSTWQPNSFDEWEGRERVRAYLSVWTQQMDEERRLRSLYAKLIFGLVSFEVVAAFILLLLLGSGTITLDAGLLKILFPAVLTQVFGLAYLVTKYLFNQPMKHAIPKAGEK